MSVKSLRELSKILNGELKGADLEVRNISGTERAGKDGDLVYVSDVRKLEEADRGLGSALLHSFPKFQGKKPCILVKNGKLAFAKALSIFHPRPAALKGIHPTAVIDPSASIGEGASVGPYVVIGKRVKMGKNVEIAAFGFIGDDVRIDDDAILHPRVTLLEGVQVGKRCVLYEGAVIGSQGFSFATDETGKHIAVSHIGTVILEDDVEVGANSTIDRGTLGITRIGSGTKIDNLVQIAHNCAIASDCIIAALAGIAGSVVVQRGAVLGGHTGIKDHAVIGEGVMIAGGSHVWGDIPDRSVYSGTPARPHKDQLKLHALLRRLPELFQKKTKR